MAGSPVWKVYRGGLYIAAFKRLDDALMFVGLRGKGTTLRHGHNKTVWTEGMEETSPTESVDAAIAIVRARWDGIRLQGGLA